MAIQYSSIALMYDQIEISSRNPRLFILSFVIQQQQSSLYVIISSPVDTAISSTVQTNTVLLSQNNRKIILCDPILHWPAEQSRDSCEKWGKNKRLSESTETCSDLPDSSSSTAEQEEKLRTDSAPSRKAPGSPPGRSR